MLIEKKNGATEVIKRRQHKQQQQLSFIIDIEWWNLPREHNVL